jgi:hypothetical protein
MQSRPQNDQERPRSPNGATRRLEAFSDAVFAIAITLLTFTLQVPVLTTVTPQALVATLAGKWPTYLGFLLSFLTLLIAWVYHHRLLEGRNTRELGSSFSMGCSCSSFRWFPSLQHCLELI